MLSRQCLKISVDFKCISFGGLLLFVNRWNFDLFFVHFLKCLKKGKIYFGSDITVFLSCFFFLHILASVLLTKKHLIQYVWLMIYRSWNAEGKYEEHARIEICFRIFAKKNACENIFVVFAFCLKTLKGIPTGNSLCKLPKLCWSFI